MKIVQRGMFFLILIGASVSRVTATVIQSDKYVQLAKSLVPDLCSGADVCLNDSTTVTENLFAPGFMSCCTACSCKTDCTNNCCFPREQPEVQQSEYVCLYPMTHQPGILDEDLRLQYNSYKMVTSVLVSDGNNHTSALKCGDVKVAPWGSFLPVYSKKAHMIYKNTACAQAAGVLDGIVWDAVVSCKVKGVQTKDANSLIGLHSEYWSDSCHVQFLYPGDYSDINFLVCFENLISTCLPIPFEIPPQLQQLSRKEIRKACKSGLVSPFRLSRMYANVFCYICNAHTFQSTLQCSKPDRNRRGGAFGSFVALFDIRKLVKTSEENTFEKPIVKQAYYMDGKNELTFSRKIACPSGRDRDKTGACVFPVKEWFVDSIGVCVKLTSITSFNINEVLKVVNSRFDVVSRLSYQWPKHWFIKSISYELLSESNHKHLYVKMVNKSPITNPGKLLKNIQNLLSFPWTLQVKDNLVPMTAEIMHMIGPFHEETFLKAENDVDIPEYVYAYEHMQNSYFPFLITPLYYNEQIELKESEFELFRSNEVLLDKITNKTYLIGDFAIINHSDGHRRARISLVNSGFSKAVQNDGIDLMAVI